MPNKTIETTIKTMTIIAINSIVGIPFGGLVVNRSQGSSEQLVRNNCILGNMALNGFHST